jgi:hypothetical protein
VWRYDLDEATWFGNAMQFRDEAHHIGNVFDHMPTNDLVKFVVRKRIRNGAQIVNYIRLSPRIRVNTDSPGIFVLAAANVESSFGGWV